MNDALLFFTPQQKEFLQEIANIGGGNAARAIEEILQHKVDKSISTVNVFKIEQVSKIVGSTNAAESCVHTRLTGDLTAEMLLIIPAQQYRSLTQQMRGVSSPTGDITDADVMTEFGNMLIGAYTTALHDFCRLDISYTVPEYIMDMPPALLDEAIAHQAQELACVVSINNEFVISQMGVHALLLLLPTKSGLEALVASIDEARTALTGMRSLHLRRTPLPL